MTLPWNKAGPGQHRNAHRTEHGEAPARQGCGRGRRGRDQQQQRHQAAQPGARGEQMRDVGQQEHAGSRSPGADRHSPGVIVPGLRRHGRRGDQARSPMPPDAEQHAGKHQHGHTRGDQVSEQRCLQNDPRGRCRSRHVHALAHHSQPADSTIAASSDHAATRRNARRTGDAATPRTASTAGANHASASSAPKLESSPASAPARSRTRAGPPFRIEAGNHPARYGTTVEGELALGLVRVDRDRVPLHSIDTRRQFLHIDDQRLRITGCGMHVVLVHGRTRRVGDGDGAEPRLHALAEMERDLRRCGTDRAADRRIGFLQLGMGHRDGRPGQDCGDDAQATHGAGPLHSKIGLPSPVPPG